MTDFWGNPTDWKGEWIVDLSSITITNEEYGRYFRTDETWEKQQLRFLQHISEYGLLDIAQIVEGWEDGNA